MGLTKNVFELSKKSLTEHEGLRLKPYRCTADKLTIGYGRNLEDKGISKLEAEMLLLNDIEEIEDALEKVFVFFNNLSDARKAVLIDMAYNIGIKGLLNFKKMLLSLEKGDYQAASNDMLESAWANQVGIRAVNLSKIMANGK
jgi:lysozyme